MFLIDENAYYREVSIGTMDRDQLMSLIEGEKDELGNLIYKRKDGKIYELMDLDVLLTVSSKGYVKDFIIELEKHYKNKIQKMKDDQIQKDNKELFRFKEQDWFTQPTITPYTPLKLDDNNPLSPNYKHPVWCSTTTNTSPFEIFEEIPQLKGNFILGNRQTIGK